MRLDKFLSHNGFGSRKQVRYLLKEKLVTLNGEITQNHGYILDLDKDEVCVNGEPITYVKDVYYMLNKPQGYISSTESDLYPSVLELIDSHRSDLIIVGRLDVDTEGLLLITNDGKFSHNISHGKKDIHKTYHVELKDAFDTDFVQQIEEGLFLEGKRIKPASVKLIEPHTIELSIAEGKYHQVKRMMHACDNEVLYLKRIRIGTLNLDAYLKLGDYRNLSKVEIEKLLTQ
ncbi:MAG: rRNA pseudouridine synthase [Erysipelothrix sp.]|nr:rRNA pseudouridine synthase [Erysipelothrix sp.]